MPSDNRIPYEDTYGNWDNATVIPVVDLAITGAIVLVLVGVFACEVLGWL